jgi:glycosyltransferase involved in cell wall biosynthesis
MAKVLFVTCHLPYPLISGGRRREYELISRLAREYEIHLLAFTKTYREDSENTAALRDACRSVTILPVECVTDPYLPSQVGRHACGDGVATLRRIVRRNGIDLVHVEGFYVMQHVPDDLTIPVFLQEQNVEYLLWKQRAERARHPRAKTTALWEYMRTIDAEVAAWRRADACGAVTYDDLRVMRRALPSVNVRLVPDGLDHLDRREAEAVTRHEPDRRPPVASFVANFAYQPNVDAALYLAERIWPLISKRMPHARLLLVGNAPPPEVQALGARSPSITVTGRVPDVGCYLDESDVVLCPLRVGGGIKVKILEALSRGKAIVTTAIGAQGIPRPEQAMRVVEDPVEFARAALEILSRPETRLDLERRARVAANELPTWDDAAHALGACYGDLLRAPRIVRFEPLGTSDARPELEAAHDR